LILSSIIILFSNISRAIQLSLKRYIVTRTKPPIPLHSVAVPHHFYAAPAPDQAPGKNFDAAPAPAPAPAPTRLYSKAKFLK
jgi:hypothetical protein